MPPCSATVRMATRVLFRLFLRSLDELEVLAEPDGDALPLAFLVRLLEADSDAAQVELDLPPSGEVFGEADHQVQPGPDDDSRVKTEVGAGRADILERGRLGEFLAMGEAALDQGGQGQFQSS